MCVPTGKESALQIRSVRVWQKEGAMNHRFGSQAAPSPYAPQSSSSSPVHQPRTSAAIPHTTSGTCCLGTSARWFHVLLDVVLPRAL
jgi:hypothetical protein